jgi:hypothetical protein
MHTRQIMFDHVKNASHEKLEELLEMIGDRDVAGTSHAAMVHHFCDRYEESDLCIHDVMAVLYADHNA